MTDDELIISGRLCPYCRAKTVHVPDTEVYNTGFGGMIYLCRNCDAYVGCHKGKPTESKGRVADADLRKWKMLAHQYFDGLWRAKKSIAPNIARARAYRWLSAELDIEPERCHIGMFDVEDCQRVVNICKLYYKTA